jgi:hypothetical protein
MEVRLYAQMQNLLDDLDNIGGCHRLAYMGHLGKLVFRYGVAAMDQKRNITFAEQCKELDPARLRLRLQQPPTSPPAIGRCRAPIAHACA